MNLLQYRRVRRQVAGGRSEQPAVIISLSSGSAAAPAQTTAALPSLGLDKVDNALSWAAGANGLADLAAHFSWSHVAAQYRNAVADRDLAGVVGGAANSAAHALTYASDLGIPIKDSASPEAVKNGAAPGAISIGAFSFTNGGSTYAVTPGKVGTLVGTRDGQAWKTWQLSATSSPASTDTGATAALQTLTAFNAQDAAGEKLLSLLNVSA